MNEMNFTAIDVETANSNRGSVCAVGVTVVRAGKIKRAVEWHVKPEAGLGSFSPRNVAIHGITEDMVRTANSWSQSLDAITSLAENYPMVAYNAPFDRSAIVQASEFSGLSAPANEFHCALALSRRLLALESYKLSQVVSELGLDSFEHHRAGADAAACAQVVLSLAEREGARTVSELWIPTKKTPVRSPDYWSKDKLSRKSELPQPSPSAAPDHPFNGQQVIFTGELQTCDRWEAMELVAHNGGSNGQGVTKKTGFLVVGGVNEPGSIDLANGTTKERKAALYIEQGQNIRVITEPQFLKLVGRNRQPGRGLHIAVQQSPRTGHGAIARNSDPLVSRGGTRNRKAHEPAVDADAASRRRGWLPRLLGIVVESLRRGPGGIHKP